MRIIKYSVFCLLAFLLVSCRSIETSRYDLELQAGRSSESQVHGSAEPNLEEQTLRIVLITDLHSDNFEKKQPGLIEKIRAERPDLILLAGDIIDDKAPLDGTVILLEGIRNMAPVYYVTGNHEYMRRDFPRMMALLRSFGVKILSDTYTNVSVKGITLIIAGLNDPEGALLLANSKKNPSRKKYRKAVNQQAELMERTFRELDAVSDYKILMAHRPELIGVYRRFSFDLVVSGHAHGGQVRLPPLIKNGLYSPHQGLFPKYSGGIYVYDGLVHIVSRGLTIKRPPLPRIFNSPDLVVILLRLL